MQKDTIQRFIVNFNEDFKSNIPIDSFAFLKDIYEQSVGPNISSEFEKQYVKELEKLVDKLYTSFNKQQRVLFNRFDDLKNKMQNNSEEQHFIYGFCISKLLDKIDNTTSK